MLCCDMWGGPMWESVIVWAYAVLIWFALPVSLIWGWARWSIHKKSATLFSVFSFAGFASATASALLAIASVAYVNLVGGFAFYDPRLMRIFFWGGVLSIAGLVFGVTGVWRANPLRWHAPLCALGTLVFWIMAAEGE